MTLLVDARPDIAAEWHPSNSLSLDSITVGSNKRAMWICPEGHSYESRVGHRTDLTRSRGCPYCSYKKISPEYNSVSKTNPEVMKFWNEDVALADEVSALTNKIISWLCDAGHTWKKGIAAQVKNNICPECTNRYVLPGRAISSHVSYASLERLAEEWSDKNDKPLDYYSYQSGHIATWECADGHEWEAAIYNRTKDEYTGCPKCCLRQTSGAEKSLADFISTLSDNVITNTRNVIYPYELDVYLPDQKIAVEFNGLYWHREEAIGKTRHYDKWQACNRLGIQLITVWEDDWRDRRNVVEKMLSTKITGRKSVGARKTVACNITYKEAAAFLDNWHIQGASSGSRYIGLKHHGDLVAVMVLTRDKDIYRLDRYASSVSIPGGLIKMIKFSGYSRFITFADRTVSGGELYEKTGWTRTGELRPDYRYIYKDTRVHKFSFRRSRFKNDPKLQYNPSLTEKQLAELNGIHRIWDSGKVKYELVVK